MVFSEINVQLNQQKLENRKHFFYPRQDSVISFLLNSSLHKNKTFMTI